MTPATAADHLPNASPPGSRGDQPVDQTPSSGQDPSVPSSSGSPAKNRRTQSPIRIPNFRTSSTGSSHSGGGVLARLASNSSVKSREPDSPTSSPKSDRDSSPSRLRSGHRKNSQSSSFSGHRLSKAELAELSKPKGKYKSGIRWDQYDEPEPFMETSAATGSGDLSTDFENVQSDASMLQVGSTAAAKMYAQSIGLGQSALTTSRSRSASDQSRRRESLVATPPTTSETVDGGYKPSEAVQVVQVSSSVPPAKTSEAESGWDLVHSNLDDSTSLGLHSPPGGPTESPPVARADNRMVAEAAQRVLEAARRAARGQPMPDNWEPPRREGLPLLSEAVPNGEALGKAAKAEASSSSRPSPKASPSQLPLTKSSNSLSPQPLSAKPNRYSFLGLGSSTEKSSKKPKSRRPSETAPEPAAPPSDSADASTVGRRRRFVDTRELDLLASELAAQALLGGMPQPPFAFSGQSGASSPRSIGRSPLADPRRGSYYSTASGRDTPHNLSQTSLASNAMLNAMAGMPIPGRSRDASFASPGSSLPGSPPMLTHEMPRVESFNQTARSSPSTSFTHPATSLVPHDMLTGLGDGPYPAMPRRRDPLDGLDGLDPFGIPILSESPFDATAAYASRTNMHHSPVQIAPSRSRVGSSGASSMGGKRSVLSMTMHDPEAELQGLTKPPKSKRNTPFGSRANSRAVTPSTSSSALREKARNSNQEPPLSKRPSPDVAALSQIEKRAGHIPNAPTKGAEVDKAEVGAEVASAQHGVGAPQASAGGETAARPLSSANGSKNTESSATVKSEEQKSKQSQDQASSLSPPKSNQKKRLSIFGRSKEKDGGKRVKVTAASATTDRKVLSMNDLGSQKGNSVNEGESPSRKVTAQDLSGKEAVAEPRGGSNETSNVLAVVPNIQQYQEDQLPVAPSPKPVVSKAGHSVDETVKKLPEDKATEASPSCPNEADSKQKATSPPGTVQDGIKPSFIASTNAETRSLDVALTKGSRAPRAPSSHGLEPPQITSISNKKSDAASSTSARKNGGTLKKFMRRLSIFGSSKSQKPPTPPIPTMPMLAKEVGAAQPSSDSGRLKASEHDTAAHGKAASSPPGAKEAITSLSPASQSSSRLTPSSDTTTNAVGQASLFTVKTDSGLPEASRNDEESGPQLADSNQGGTYVHPDMAQNGFGTRSAKHSIEPPSLRESNADSVEDSRKISTPSTASLLMVRPASADRSDSGLSAGGETKRSDLTPSLEEDGLSPHSTETSADGTASTRSIDTGVISSSADNKSEIHVVDMATGKERGPISQAKVYSLPAVPSTATVV